MSTRKHLIVLGVAGAAVIAVAYFQRKRKPKGSEAVAYAKTDRIEPQVLSKLSNGSARMIYNCGNKVGEGLVWSVEQQCLFWIDIEGKKFHRLYYQSGEVTIWQLHTRAGSYAIREGPPDQEYPFLFAFEDGFALYNPETGHAKYLKDSEYRQLPNTRLNDGRCDRQGRFVCGGGNLEHLDESLDVWKARVKAYRVDTKLRVREILPERMFRMYNGTCFSPDGRTMYMTDTPTKEIWAYDYDTDSGAISNGRVFTKLAENSGVPDGATCDSEGCVWSAEFFGARVNRFDSRGNLIEYIPIHDARRPTCVAIGGPQLDILFVTTASLGLTETEKGPSSKAGALFAIKLQAKGLPEPKFAG